MLAVCVLLLYECRMRAAGVCAYDVRATGAAVYTCRVRAAGAVSISCVAAGVVWVPCAWCRVCMPYVRAAGAAVYACRVRAAGLIIYNSNHNHWCVYCIRAVYVLRGLCTACLPCACCRFRSVVCVLRIVMQKNTFFFCSVFFCKKKKLKKLFFNWYVY